MNVKELYMDCFYYEESSLAHYLHHLLAEKKISLEDYISKIDFEQANDQKVAEMITTNTLAFHKICIYSLKMNNNDFVFIFAACQQEAIQFYRKRFHQKPLNCHEYSLDFQFDRDNAVISFREMRQEFTSFAAIAGYFNREEFTYLF